MGDISMKRLQVHVSVDDLAASIRFYNTLFAAEPNVIKSDYANYSTDPVAESNKPCCIPLPREAQPA